MGTAVLASATLVTGCGTDTACVSDCLGTTWASLRSRCRLQLDKRTIKIANKPSPRDIEVCMKFASGQPNRMILESQRKRGSRERLKFHTRRNYVVLSVLNLTIRGGPCFCHRIFGRAQVLEERAPAAVVGFHQRKFQPRVGLLEIVDHLFRPVEERRCEVNG